MPAAFPDSADTNVVDVEILGDGDNVNVSNEGIDAILQEESSQLLASTASTKAAKMTTKLKKDVAPSVPLRRSNRFEKGNSSGK